MEKMIEQLEKLRELILKLENNELEVSELLYLEDAARSLYEKAVILKYKAFEEKASVKIAKAITKNSEEIDNQINISNEKPLEEPTFDFGIFDTKEDTSIPTEIKEEIIEEKPILNTKEQIKEEESIATESMIEDSIEEKEDSIEEKESITSSANNENSIEAIFGKLATEDDSLVSQFSGGKIDSLKGAFGLNQKLRFINELFDGSSEGLANAVNKLDKLQHLLEATQEVTVIAEAQTWDLEDEVVVEFLSYIKRRYS